jgi:hypothetical protein
VARSAEALKAQAGAAAVTLHGYDPSFAAPRPHPSTLPVLPRQLHVPPLQVPAALAWALNCPASRPQQRVAAPAAGVEQPAPQLATAPAAAAVAAAVEEEEGADPLPPAAARSTEPTAPSVPTSVHLPSLQMPEFEGASPGGKEEGGGEEGEAGAEVEGARSDGGGGGGGGGGGAHTWVSPAWRSSAHGEAPGAAVRVAGGGLRLFPPPAQPEEPPPLPQPLSPPPGLLPPGLSIVVPQAVGEDGRVQLFQRPAGAKGLQLRATPAPSATPGAMRLFPRPNQQ